MMRIIWLAGVLLGIGLARAGEEGPVVYWKFDEGRGAMVEDLSGNKLAGEMRAAWGQSPAGGAAVLDGTEKTVVSVEVPQGKRLGKESWTVMAWVKPKLFEIKDRQNQRRLFSYGAYPRASFNLDILSTGEPTLYQVHTSGKTSIDCGVTAAKALVLDTWAHVAVACDRTLRTSTIYINGRLVGEQKLPPEFDADLNVDGQFTVGSSWHNFHGSVDEVRLYRRALGAKEVRAEFERLRGDFKIILTPAEQADDARAKAAEMLAAANAARAKGDLAMAVQAWTGIVGDASAPAHYRSYAHLRLARSGVVAGQLDQAREHYAKIAATAEYPSVHREEATELLRELDRLAKRLPARDPSASQVTTRPAPAARVSICIAPGGNDANPGTIEKPLATLIKARDMARLAMSKTAGGVEIVLAPGEYRMMGTLPLSEQDRGTADAPVVWRAQKPGTAVLYGGQRITGFAAVTDPAVLNRLPAEARDKVVQVDLKAAGIKDFPALAVRGMGQPPSPATLELYVDQRPMTLARWPNEGFVKPAKLVEPGAIKPHKPSVLAYEGDRPARWVNAADGWLFGYFHFLWADATAKIGRIDPAARTISTAEPYNYIGTMSEEQGIIYYAFNLLEELDAPGEWYLDRESGVLYLYPPSDLAKATVEISILNGAMIDASRLAHVRFEGLVLDLGRLDGIVLRDSSDCLIAGCTVRRMAGSGISIVGGERDMILSCDIHTIGRRASEVIGGDRATLRPGGHVVANCCIHDFGRIDRTYTPGVQLEGVGNRVAHNKFFNCPSSVMRIEGNDHLIEYNDVHDALLESDDQGAMELYGNPSYRGVVFKHNWFRRIGSPAGRAMVNGQAGIRLDDAISGVVIYGNVFERAAKGNFGGLNMNSGRDNIIDNNIFAECAQGISGGYHGNNEVWRELRAGRKREDIITSALYLKRYPEMVKMLAEPAENHAWRNIFYHCGRDISGNKAALDLLANGAYEQDPGFVDAGKGNWGLKRDSAVLQSMGFRAIPVDEIGLYRDRWRSDLAPASGPGK